jgi:hypothetical protein
MQSYQPHWAKTVSYYHLLLQRYARRLVHDKSTAATIVQEVLESQYVLNYCFYHIQVKMFGRPAEKSLCRNRIKILFQTDAGKPPLTT